MTVLRLARLRGPRGPIDQREASPKGEEHLLWRKRATMTRKRRRSMRMRKMRTSIMVARRTRVIRNQIVRNSNSYKYHRSNRSKSPSRHHLSNKQLVDKRRSLRKC